MRVKRFEDLIAWQKGQEPAVEIYKAFSNCRDYDFRNQICRASVSISNNIAEGFGRYSDNQFAHFLDIAGGSCNEVKSMVYLAERLQYVTESEKVRLLALSEEQSKIIYSLTQTVRKNKP